jgi:predicted solute-binding protein
MFQNEYTGFDAAFEEYFTNTRYTLSQEAEADLLALRVIQECGFELNTGQYRAILKMIQNDEEPKP